VKSGQQLLVSMYENSRLFPRKLPDSSQQDGRDITSCVIGTKLGENHIHNFDSILCSSHVFVWYLIVFLIDLINLECYDYWNGVMYMHNSKGSFLGLYHRTSL
jgi:hypothetical protein